MKAAPATLERELDAVVIGLARDLARRDHAAEQARKALAGRDSPEEHAPVGRPADSQ